ncbi:MAG: TetR/AcrR family transcriptional regulator [SAR324 cluster bacterium]|jgi:AcrR family transcriptional regulator|nr:TetR/AcrR family transcriptional regulator [SAR324 cluster bacterium]MCH2265875.1 TetR/AcrR family transcriptional regulator [SAR324 cluster bacterium]
MKRSDKTRGTILDEAIYIASKTGFEALTIGKLASAVGMSKSGLFAHFNSKEQLQVDVLKAVAKKFADKVITPSLKAARGEPRIRAIAKNWLAWTNAKFMPGGCLFLTATVEFDDKPGPVRDFLVSNQKLWIHFIAQAAALAVEEGQFRKELDTEQFTYEFHSIYQSYHYASRLLNDPQAESRVWNMLDKLLENARA